MNLREWQRSTIGANEPIRKAIDVIEASPIGIAVVIDDDDRMIGSLDDFQIRQAMLSNKSLEEPAYLVMESSSIKSNESVVEVPNHSFAAFVDENGRLTGLARLPEDACDKPSPLNNPIMILLPGDELVLAPGDLSVPRPMLKFMNKPLLEWTLTRFAQQGFKNFLFAFKHKIGLIEDYFQDGSLWGVSISYLDIGAQFKSAPEYSRQDHPHPTAIVNGSLLTRVNLVQLFDYHRRCEADATIGVTEFHIAIPHATVAHDGSKLLSIAERNIVNKKWIDAGIYIANSEFLDTALQKDVFSLPQTFNQLARQNRKVAVCPIHEQWLDICSYDSYREAQSSFVEINGMEPEPNQSIDAQSRTIQIIRPPGTIGCHSALNSSGYVLNS